LRSAALDAADPAVGTIPAAVLDSLTHVTPDGRWFHTAYDASETRLMRELDECQIARSVVVALAEFIPNEFVLQLCRRHPERLVPGASFNPAAWRNPIEAACEFRTLLHGAPYSVLKLHPRLNRYEPLDPRCLAVLEELASWTRPLPVWLDSLFYFRGGILREPPVHALHEIVGRFPTLEFVILHSCGTQALALAEAVRDCPNAWLDMSFTLTRYEGSSVWTDLRHLLDRFDRRMIWGSDFPEVPIRDGLAAFRRLADGATSEKATRVLGSNLSNLLKEHGA
jgi:predicted TIM-barrel fold metal-dependent hydrolase